MLPALTIGSSRVNATDAATATALLVVPDVRGTYAVPHIQSDGTLVVALAGEGEWDLALWHGSTCRGHRRLSAAMPQAAFTGLESGEYEMWVTSARGDTGGKVGPLGIGTVVAAIGDSITEGYCGRGYRRGETLGADDFPDEAVSRDRRNFPQYAPTTHAHLPEVNCFQSWMSELNDLLTRALEHPVFIANEGWGGISTGGYLAMMARDRGWQERMQLLRPTLWLIHLGVNDERAQVEPRAVAGNLEAIADILCRDYGAERQRILLARPSFDYFPGAEGILRGYCTEIDRLVRDHGFAAGPDFFTAFSTDQERWYDADPVHPNVAGVSRMAQLWCEAISRLPIFAHGGKP